MTGTEEMMSVFQQCVKTGALTIEHLTAGLTLQEPDDHTLALMADDKVIARFGCMVEVKAIRKAADKYLDGGS